MTGESIYLKRHKTIPIGVIWMGVATAAGAANTFVDTDIPAAYIADIFKDERLFIYAGTGAGQTRKIQAYASGTHTFTLYDNWTTNPDTDSRYQVIAGDGISGGAAGDATLAKQNTIIGKVDVVDGYHDVPVADVVDNAQMRDVIGNKTDGAVTTVGAQKTLMAYLKGILNQVATAITNIGTIRSSQLLELGRLQFTIDSTAGDQTIINAVFPSNVIQTTDADVDQVLLHIHWSINNTFDGANSLARTNGENYLKVNNAGAGDTNVHQYVDGDWAMLSISESRVIHQVFDITAIATNVDGTYTVKLVNADAAQNSLVVYAEVWLEVVFHQ